MNLRTYLFPLALFAVTVLTASANAELVVHYTLDDDGAGAVSTVNSGSSGHTWNGTANVNSVAGKFGEAGAFQVADPASDWWSNADTGANLELFTLSLHINTTTALNWQDFASIGDGNASSFKFEQNAADRVSVYTDGTPGSGVAVSISGEGGPSVNDGAWHHLAMVSNGSTIELFVDGISRGSEAYTGTGDIVALQLAAAFGAGRRQNVTIDDVAVYDVALNAAQISYLGNNVANNTASNTGSVLLGDVNLDGVVDFSDITPFITVLSNSTNQAEADCNESGAVDFSDITPFIAILSNQGS